MRSRYDNPDKYIRELYGSVLRAMWTTSIYLNGEWVFCDFTWTGKAVGGFIVLFGVSIMVVPMSVWDSILDRLLSPNTLRSLRASS